MSNSGDQQPPAGAPKRYACRNCGHPYDSYPPDDLHKTARLTPCEKGDSIAQNYDYDNYGQQNTLHWDEVHIWVKPIGPRRTGYYPEEWKFLLLLVLNSSNELDIV
jgi:hypothetical protein